MRPPPREDGRIKITGSGRSRGPIPPPARVFFPISVFTKKLSDEMQRLNTCISKAEPKIFFCPARDPLPGGEGWPKFNQLESVTTFLTGGGAIGLSPLKANELEEDKGKLSWTGYLPHVEINGTSMKF